jgi:glycosyltransferase involved in cell wall biosynthesis
MKFCVVYPYATWFSGKSCGGAEKQVGLLAQHLARRGHAVTFIALDSRSPERQVDGVRIRVPWQRGEGVPLFRVATHKLPGLRRLLRETDADVYYLRGAQALSRWVIADAHEAGARALLGLASDRNLDPSSGRMLVPFGHRPLGSVTGPLAWRLLQRPALRAADMVIAQNEQQAARCAQMGLPHALVPSIVEPPASRLLESPVDYDVFWAGNVHNAARRGKGVEPLLALVKSLPAARFAIVGALKDASLSGVLRELQGSPNADVFGRLGYDETQALLARSRLVLNTSPVEGFSNVMLEGWSLGRPSLTLAVNPSRLLSEGRWPPGERQAGGHEGMLGATAGGDVGTLTRLIGEALVDESALRSAGRRCRAYITEVHDPDAVCARYEALATSPLA